MPIVMSAPARTAGDDKKQQQQQQQQQRQFSVRPILSKISRGRMPQSPAGESGNLHRRSQGCRFDEITKFGIFKVQWIRFFSRSVYASPGRAANLSLPEASVMAEPSRQQATRAFAAGGWS